MPSTLESWPAWPEFGVQLEDTKRDPWFARAKAEIISEYGEEAIRQGWLKACKSLEEVTQELGSLGTSAIPIFEMHSILDNKGFTEEQKDLMKSRGCCIVKSVLSEEEASAKYCDLKEYIAQNKDSIMGWPAGSPSIFNLYNSSTQVSVRTHPNQILLQKILNSLYHDTTAQTSPEPLSYTDAARVRPPGQEFLGLGPHIDAGSLARWADYAYRKAYHHVFSGFPEKHDVYDLGSRKDANQHKFPARAHSCVFRSFQGWTALTPASPSCGTLMLYPNVSTVIAYVLLRPFFAPPADEKDVMDASKWTFDPTSDYFPGTMVDQSQRLSISSHPHLRLQDTLIYIPKINPGDTVWWHTDMCHAVDPMHNGTIDASVVYVPACPTTNINKGYVKRQLENALNGLPPPDRIGVELDERKLNGYKGFDDVSEEGKAALGFALL
ncbi:hypothetical protein JX265_001989 [Neoarthrinium moseri]|uniref:DUF1479-domain-containing protein n=1 Tax=Neoarthrinium moseri TaxID=1658444 RepID=A0A9Q0AV46_9PEZI|nr:hypothetical protein JX265_001989 [Neoarthrinium moseri]